MRAQRPRPKVHNGIYSDAFSNDTGHILIANDLQQTEVRLTLVMFFLTRQNLKYGGDDVFFIDPCQEIATTSKVGALF